MKSMLWRLCLVAMIGVGVSFVDLGGPQPLSMATALAQTNGVPPGGTLGKTSDADLWRQIRRGEPGLVSIPNPQAAVMVQSDGDGWRALRNGPVSTYGAWAFAAMLAGLAGFFLIRGRIRIEAGRSGRRIERFKPIERAAHWVTAGSFLLLAITGLNILYGRYVLPQVIGADAFSTLSIAGKYVHNYISFLFMVGLLMIIVLWVRDNVWDRYDGNWILKGGGLLTKGTHPPAAKFNFGQKTMFWAVAISGVILSITGLNLLFPYVLTDLGGMQFLQITHSITSLVITVLMLAHIYIGSVGMEEAIDAMKSGYVDENWLKEHHSAWLDEITQGRTDKAAPGEAKGHPAE